jgi:glycosyltransferase involved in cell wall biosynthesis
MRQGVTAGGDTRSASLRILVVNWLDRENPQAGGAETHLHEVFGRLVRRGHQVTTLVSGWSGCAPRVTLDGIDVHRTGRRYTFSLAAPRYYRKHLAGLHFDVVVEDLNKIPLYTPFWTNAPVVLLAHHLFGTTAFQAAPFPVAAASWLLERDVPKVFKNVPTIAVSESTKEDLVRRGMLAERIRVVPNGIDLAYFSPSSAPRAPRPTLLFVGRLKKYKRVDLVVDAMALLASENVDVEFHIVGEGEQRPAIEAQIRRLRLGGRVRMSGFVSEEEKREAFRRAWIHVLTSPKEGWGISNLEAAACGTPSVASDAPGLRESVVDGQTGLLVPHGDVPALGGAIRSLLADGARREEMGRKGRAFAERFSWDASTDGVESILREVVVQDRRH